MFFWHPSGHITRQGKNNGFQHIHSKVLVKELRKKVVNMKTISSIMCLSWVLLSTCLVFGYTETTVTNGGHISGTVILKGQKPQPKAFNLITYPETVFCGRISTGTIWRLLDQFQVDATGGLQNALVMLEGIESGKPFSRMASTIEAKDCILTPPVMAVRPNQNIEVVNMDPIIHDIQVYEMAPFGAEVIFHRPLRMNPYHLKGAAGSHDHLPGEPLIDTMKFTKGRRIFYLECGFHEFMQTWGVAVTNPYYAMTDTQGRFTLSDIPEGVYTLIAWHPGMGGILDMQAVVLSGDTLKVRFEFGTPKDRRVAHTKMVKNPHFDAGTLSTFGFDIDIQPTHEIQQP